MYATLFAALATLFSPGQGGQTLSADEIQRQVERAVSQRLSAIGSAASIERIEGVSAQPLPPGTARIDVGDVAGRWPRKEASVAVRLSVDGHRIRSMVVRVVLKDERAVPTYAQSAPAGRPAADLRFVVRTVDMLCCDGESVADRKSLSNLRIRRAVRAGQPAMRSDFEPIPEVATRDRVEIDLVRGAVHIATLGTALADARMGERVAIRPDLSETTVIGRVIGNKRVMIDASSY